MGALHSQCWAWGSALLRFSPHPQIPDRVMIPQTSHTICSWVILQLHAYGALRTEHMPLRAAPSCRRITLHVLVLGMMPRSRGALWFRQLR